MGADSPTPRTENGLLLIADISGYTSFLGLVATAHPDMTEVAPAYPVLTGMLDTVVESIAPTFTLADIEGDAVFAYAPGDRLTGSGDDVLAVVRSAYVAYRARIQEAMVVHYHPCTACTVLPTLELKFVLHQGAFVVQKVAGHERILGPAVILVHRLLKNSVTEKMGKRAYVFITDDAVAEMKLSRRSGLPHEEHYLDVGTVRGLVLDVVTSPATPAMSMD